MHGKLTPQEDRVGDFASQESTEALDTSAMVTVCEQEPRFLADQAVATRPSRPDDPPEDDPQAGNAPKSPPPPPELPSVRFSLNSLPTNESDEKDLLPETTGVTYYLYRHYDPLTGRWPSRDQIEERGGVNLYVFLNNASIKKFDILGKYSSYEEARDAARDAVGSLAAHSRKEGVEQVFDLVPPPMVGHPGDGLTGPALFTKDAALYWVNEDRLPKYMNGVAGVEYSTTVYCDPKKFGNSFQHTPPDRGELPTSAQYKGGTRGLSSVTNPPEGTKLLAEMHTHTMTGFFVNSNGSITSEFNFGPVNTSASPIDLSWSRQGDEERFIVHEHVGLFFLKEY